MHYGESEIVLTPSDVAPGTPLPLTSAQHSLLAHQLQHPQSALYNVCVAVDAEGEFDAAGLRQALTSLAERHESLRAVFHAGAAGEFQTIESAAHVPFTFVNLEAQKGLEELVQEESRRAINLQDGPPWRVTLYRRGPTSHTLLLTIHHIVVDGWSLRILLDELWTIYAAITQREAVSLSPLKVSYSDYLLWSNREHSRTSLQNSLSYWRHQLAGAPLVLDIPTDHPQPKLRTFNGGVETFSLSLRLSAALEAGFARLGSTTYMGLLAAFKLLLLRYSGMNDIVVGCPLANRNHPSFDRIVGLLTNVVPLRTAIDGALSFRENIRSVIETTLSGFEHGAVPLEELIETLDIDRDGGSSPLIQVVFGFQDAPVPQRSIGDLKISSRQIPTGTAKFELTVSVERGPNGLSGSFEYSKDRFEPETIRRMIGHWQTLLDKISQDPDAPSSSLTMTSDQEYRQLLTLGAAHPPADVSWDEITIVERFEKIARVMPDATALIMPTHDGRDRATLTYGELNRRANLLANYLIRRGAKCGDRIGVLEEPSFEQVIAMLAILKAGASYVPISTKLPYERIALLVADAELNCVLTRRTLKREAADLACLIEMDAESENITAHNDRNPSRSGRLT